MSGGVQQSLVFLRLPDLKKLVCVTLSLQEEDEDARSKQIQTCSYEHLRLVVNAVFCVCVQLGCPQPAFPGDLQRCVSYSLITRLAPGWNKAGRYLISGNFSASSSDLRRCSSSAAAAAAARSQRTDTRFVPHSAGVFLLPCAFSMKKGQIVSISRQLPRDGPFRTYREYPLSCIRLQPAQRCPRVDLQGALGSFLADVGARLQTVCGFPARLSSKPCYHTVSLSAAASVQVHKHTNARLGCPRRPSCGPQPPAWAPLSQQGGAPGHGCGCQSRVSRGWGGDGGSVLPLLRPASSLTSSSVLPPPPPVQPPPKLVPVFKNKHPSHHVNVALLRLQEQSEQLGRAAARVTLPAFRKTTPAAAPPLPPPPLPPRAASSLPVRPPPTVPNFSRRPKVTHISSLSPALKPKLGLIIVPKPEIKIRSKSSSKPTTQVGSEGETVAGKMQECPTEQQQPAAPPAPSADVSKKVSPKNCPTFL
uniref:DUF4708 domain-containing protein n=1 Tax=Stegastes partitus TaxID=144197 RepID=A0A3B4ZJ42_9TELE